MGRAEIKRLNPQVVYAADPAVAADVTTALPGVKVVTDPANLPHTSAPKSLSGLTVFVPAFDQPVPRPISPPPPRWTRTTRRTPPTSGAIAERGRLPWPPALG